MEKINVLLIGGDARTHAIGWKAKQSPRAGTIYVAPGNPGTAMLGCQNIPLQPVRENLEALRDLAVHLNVKLAVIGPENALAEGIVRMFKNAGIPTFGPEMSWIIETSKVFAKDLMSEIGIPTAPYRVFIDPHEALSFAKSKDGCVIKCDGLALGKGTRVCTSVAKAEMAIDDFMIKKIHGTAGEKVIVEDLLDGPELSVQALCDGEHVKILPFLRDHKTLTDDPESSMTGGMGVCGPIDVHEDLKKFIEHKIVLPTVRHLSQIGMPFVGCLYPGLILTKDGPMVLEFNARFCDPGTQLHMRLLEDDVDFLDVLMACTEGRLDKVDLRWKDSYGVCITLVAAGYPDTPRKNDDVFVIRDQRERVQPIVFHGATAWSDGWLVTSGGRVLSVTMLTGKNKSAASALEWIKPAEGMISFTGMQYRKDIGAVW
jgi:phosphoribosylamine--glycine ligase